MSSPRETAREKSRAPRGPGYVPGATSAASAAPVMSSRIAEIVRLALGEQRVAVEEDLGARQAEHAALARVVSTLRQAIAARIAIINREHPLLVEEGESGDVDFLMAVTRSKSQKIREIIGEKVRAAIDAFLELNGSVEGLRAALVGLDDAAAVIQEVGGAVRKAAGPDTEAATAGRNTEAAAVAEDGDDDIQLGERVPRAKLPNRILAYVHEHDGEIRVNEVTLAHFGYRLSSRGTFLAAVSELIEQEKLVKVGKHKKTHYVIAKSTA